MNQLSSGTNSPSKVLHVSVAVIQNPFGHFLISQRQPHQSYAGLWEFPGGKVEEGESPKVALCREITEELGIAIRNATPLIELNLEDNGVEVHLHVWHVIDYVGEAKGMEGQTIAWVESKQWGEYPYLPANKPIWAAARLPDCYWITPDLKNPDELLHGAQLAIAQGCKLILFRAPSYYDPAYRELAADIQGLCAGKTQLMLKGPLEWTGDFPAAGWHLSSKQLKTYHAQGRPFPNDRWLAASCHNLDELQLAESMGVDFVTLSPVLQTQSHPNVSPLGWPKVQAWIAKINMPVYVLGGLQPNHLPQAKEMGAQGIAAIRSLWGHVS